MPTAAKTFFPAPHDPEPHVGSLVLLACPRPASGAGRMNAAARGKQRNRSMRSRLLLTTAALLAGLGLASAQNMPGGGAQPGAGAQPQAPQSSPGQRAQEKLGQDKQGHDKQGQALPGQRGQQKEQTTGQAQREQTAPGKSEAVPGKNGQQDKAQPQRSQRDREQTTGQGQRDQMQSPTQREPSPGQAQSP